MLDGGHLLFYVVEFIKGSPVNENLAQIGQRMGFALLMLLMGFGIFNDISRIFLV
jgi:regulator of sigma E protease